MASRFPILCVVCLLAAASGMSIQGDTNTIEGWQLLDIFSVGSDKAHFRYKITFPRNYASMNLLFYGENQYQTAKNSGQTCSEKFDYLMRTAGDRQILRLDSSNAKAGCYNRYDAEKGDLVYCTGDFHINTGTGGRWYVVANRCGDQNGITGLDFKYYIDAILDVFPFLSSQARITISLGTVLLFAAITWYFV